LIDEVDSHTELSFHTCGWTAGKLYNKFIREAELSLG